MHSGQHSRLEDTTFSSSFVFYEASEFVYISDIL